MTDDRRGLGQLRHLYAQMLEGRVHQEHLREAANGLLAPGIAELEHLHEMADQERLVSVGLRADFRVLQTRYAEAQAEVERLRKLAEISAASELETLELYRRNRDRLEAEVEHLRVQVRNARELCARHVDSYMPMAKAGMPAEAIVRLAADTLRSEAFARVIDEEAES